MISVPLSIDARGASAMRKSGWACGDQLVVPVGEHAGVVQVGAAHQPLVQRFGAHDARRLRPTG